MILNQIFDSINIGIVVLDSELRIYKWNRWMEAHSGLSEEKIKGSIIFDIYPDLKTPKFVRSCKSVFKLGNFCFFSQKLHRYLFPFKAASISGSEFEYMQQSCAMGPLRDENNKVEYLFIYVHDVTEVAIYQRRLVEMNWKDGLTGIYNRKYLEKKISEEFYRHKRYSHDFSIIMFDLDDFKKINDKYGHLCGDFVLQSVSSKIQSKIRNIDSLARYGGEEFCCLLYETSFDNALKVAERFRKTVEEQEFIFENQTVKVTISLGVASLRNGIDSPEQLLKFADDALYSAKGKGRNVVIPMSIY